MRTWIIALAAALLVLPGCCCESDWCCDGYGCYSGYDVWTCSTESEDYSDAYYDGLEEELAEPDPDTEVW